MATTYVNINKSEMQEFLVPKGFQEMIIPNTDEIVFGKRVDQNGIKFSIRVYTGINPSGDSRKSGSDAIRVAVFMKVGEAIKKGVSGKRVHRVLGWKANLQSRLDEIIQKLPVNTCHDCGMPMVLREGKSKEKGEPYKFYGCSGYPVCRSTQSFK
jgi:hypothetical protein